MPKKKMLTRQERIAIQEAVKAHPNASAVARDTGFSIKTVCTIAKAANIELTAGKAARGLHLISQEKRTAIEKEAHASCRDIKAVAQKYDVSTAAVYRIFGEAGIKLRPRKPLPVNGPSACLPMIVI